MSRESRGGDVDDRQDARGLVAVTGQPVSVAKGTALRSKLKGGAPNFQIKFVGRSRCDLTVIQPSKDGVASCRVRDAASFAGATYVYGLPTRDREDGTYVERPPVPCGGCMVKVE